MAQYVQIGESIDYLNTTAAVIKYGDVVALGKRIGVASADIAPTAIGTLTVQGVFEAPANASETFAVGADLYWDGTKLTATEGTNAPAGWCVLPKAAGVANARIKLVG